jgi:hypothetical protein
MNFLRCMMFSRSRRSAFTFCVAFAVALAPLGLACAFAQTPTLPPNPDLNQKEQVKRAAPAMADKPKSKAEAKTEGPKISESAKSLANPNAKSSPPAAAPQQPLPIPDVARDKVICFALYTTHKGILKLSAFFYPLNDSEDRMAVLEVQRDGAWVQVGESPVENMGWMALFRVDKWDASKDVPYRVKHAGGAVYEGTIRRDPVDKDEVVVASFSGNDGDVQDARADIVTNIKSQNPDLLFFAGGQTSHAHDHVAAWLLFGRQFGDICKDRPVVTIPGAHDVGQPHLWGEGGEISWRPDGADGGYIKPVPYVNLVQRAQCSHLPDAADPTPVKNGITVYYTSLNVGGIDFAIIEDRKWKTGPVGLVPLIDAATNSYTDPSSLDLPEAELLGTRQLKFLREWGQDWSGVSMKCVLSEAPFDSMQYRSLSVDPASGAESRTIPVLKMRPPDIADLSSNGWPQSGRNAALREMRRAFAVHVCGNQRGASAVAQYGINSLGDAPFAFVSPEIVRRQSAPSTGSENVLISLVTNRQADLLGNLCAFRAYFDSAREKEPRGHGLLRFKKSTREITLEAWPRGSDASRPRKGWPVIIKQQDNYNRAPLGWLPMLKITGAQDPVVQVVDEASNEVVYTLRIAGSQFRPRVFKQGVYTIHVGEGEHKATLTGVESAAVDEEEKTVEVIVP